MRPWMLAGVWHHEKSFWKFWRALVWAAVHQSFLHCSMCVMFIAWWLATLLLNICPFPLSQCLATPFTWMLLWSCFECNICIFPYLSLLRKIEEYSKHGGGHLMATHAQARMGPRTLFANMLSIHTFNDTCHLLIIVTFVASCHFSSV
jgi:hypothetical protein